MGAGKVRSATSGRSPKEKGRATSAGKAGMSNTICSGGGRSRSPRARKRKLAATQAQKNDTGTAREIVDRDVTIWDPTIAWAADAAKCEGAARSGPPPPRARARRELEVHVVDFVGRHSARDVAAHRAGGGDRGREHARGSGDRPHVEGRVGVDLAGRETGPVERAGAAARDAGVAHERAGGARADDVRRGRARDVGRPHVRAPGTSPSRKPPSACKNQLGTPRVAEVRVAGVALRRAADAADQRG